MKNAASIIARFYKLLQRLGGNIVANTTKKERKVTLGALQLPMSMLERVEDKAELWQCSRAEAIRRLISNGLASSD
jgi:hypothetical protein